MNTELERNVGQLCIGLLEEIPPAGLQLRREFAPSCLDCLY